MKNYQHFAQRVFNQPLLIEETKLNVILHVLGPRFGLDLESLPAIDARDLNASERQQAGYIVRNGTAIIPIQGSLVHKAGYLDAASGLTSYESLRKSFDLAIEDDAVQKIIFDVDSPGGEVSGCFDLADHIFQSRGKKPMTAMVDESCYSAAYALASAADRIVVPRTGGAGSVGVILVHCSQSNFNEKAGLTVTHIFAGAHKADFSPHRQLSDEAKTRLQGMVDDSYELFVKTVARNRRMSVEAVKKTEAGIFTGSKAVAAGLADEVAAIDKFLSGSTSTGTPVRMAAEEPAPAIDKATEDEKRMFGGQARQDADLLTAKEPAAATFEKIAADAYSKRETTRREYTQTVEPQPQEQQPAAQSTRRPTNDRDKLAAIAARVYGPEA